MQELIGGHSSDAAFAAYLADWRRVGQQRVSQAVAALSAIDGVVGLLLGGGVGRGAPWPLSDIDLLVVYADGADQPALLQAAIDAVRDALMPPWIAEGWQSGLDVGRLVYGVGEVRAALQVPPGAAAARGLLDDPRWYHAVDKGFGGHAVFERRAGDPTNLTATLASWLTASRFAPATVAQRLMATRQSIEQTLHLRAAAIANGDALGATIAQRDLVKWCVTRQLELWGERDASQARIGTRFEQVARSRGADDLLHTLRRWSVLEDADVLRRMAQAPDWLHERHDRSLRARRAVGEAVTPLEDARDVLRVGALYESRRLTTPPWPAWLAIPEDVRDLPAVDVRLPT